MSETEDERRKRKEKERAERKAKESGSKSEKPKETEEERQARKEKERKAKESEKPKETEEERQARKEKERAERKAKESEKPKETEEERQARKEKERKAKDSEKPKETEEERQARKEKERAERKAKESDSKSEKPKETEEERQARKEKERAERKAKESESKSEKPKETEEERQARKEKERAERKAKESESKSEKPKETEEERQARKEKERAERKAKESDSKSEKPKETEEERQARKEKERAERKAKESDRDHSRSKSNGKNDDLVAAIEAENRAASRTALYSRETESRAQRQREEAAAERESQERREQRRKEKEERRKSRASVDIPDPTGTSAIGAAALQRQGYRGQFEKDMTRAMALRRLVDLDDTSAVVVDLSPQTEYDMYIRNFGESGKRQAAAQAPCEEDTVSVAVQADRIRQKHKNAQIPDDLGLYPEQYTERAGFKSNDRAGKDGADDDDADDNNNNNINSEDRARRERQLVSVDPALLGSFLSRVFPIVSATLDENAPASSSNDAAKSKGGTQFSSSYTTFALSACANRPVLKTRFSITSVQYVAALHGDVTEKGPSPELDRYASVILLWNIYDSTMPERVLVSFSPISCFCFSPSRQHLVYAGMEDGSVCVWDLREGDKQHLPAGTYERLVFRLPSYATSWQADNHTSPVRQVSIAGYNTVVGVRKDEYEQLASLDEGGTVKFWAVNDRDSQAKAVISNTEYGLNIFSSVRLSLGGTSATAVAGGGDAAAGGFDFAPSDAAHYVVACAGGLVHQSRYGSVAAPAIYGPSSRFFESLVLVPCCVQYSPMDSRVLVAGYEDGTVRVFEHTHSESQLTVTVGMHPIVEVRVSSSCRWQSWVLDQSGTLHLLDSAHRERETPRLSLPLAQPDVGCCLCLDTPQEEKSVENRLLAVGFEKGVLQVHTLDNDKLQMPASERDDRWL